MAGVLFALFVVVPIVELFVLVWVASLIGVIPAMALVLVVSFAGAWLVKREGLSVARRVQDKMDRGEVPATEMVNGLLILMAGGLMVFPGFVTAFVGLILLFPPTRALVRALLMRRFEARIATSFATPAGSMFRSGFGGGRSTRVFTGRSTYGGVVDVTEVADATRDNQGDPHRADPDSGSEPPQLGRY